MELYLELNKIAVFQGTFQNLKKKMKKQIFSHSYNNVHVLYG